MFIYSHLNTLEHIKHSRKAHVVMSMTLRHFAVAISSIFVPLFLYESGYSLVEVSLFFIATQLLRALLFYPAIKIIERFGVHHTLSMSYLLAGTYMLGLYIAQFNVTGVWIALFFGAAMEVFYWAAAHIDIATIVTKKSMSSSIGTINSLLLLMQAVAPVIGGVVAATAGPEYTLLLSFAVLILATAAIHSEINYENKKQRKIFNITRPDRYLQRNMVANFFTNMIDWISGMMWPLYIYFLLGGFDTLGYVIGLGILVSLVLMHVVGKTLDAHPSIFKYGLVAKAITYPLRFVATSTGMVFITNTLSSLSYAFYGIPQGSYYHRNAKSNPVNYVYWVEVAGEFGKAMSWIFVCGLLLLGLNEAEATRTTLLIATPFVGFAYLFAKAPGRR